jgi:hypothetical protein
MSLLQKDGLTRVLPTAAVTTAAHARLPLANAVSGAKAEGEWSQNHNKHIHSWHFA